MGVDGKRINVNPRCPECNYTMKLTNLENKWLCRKCNSTYERGDYILLTNGDYEYFIWDCKVRDYNEGL